MRAHSVGLLRRQEFGFTLLGLLTFLPGAQLRGPCICMPGFVCRHARDLAPAPSGEHGQNGTQTTCVYVPCQTWANKELATCAYVLWQTWAKRYPTNLYVCSVARRLPPHKNSVLCMERRQGLYV
eukprot:366538-Chlamydomonas_euryale.AAC.9